jgi:hypothetical protein
MPIMQKSKVSRKSIAYPYSISEVICPPDHVIKKIDPWQALEFFRIEALLRSPAVHQLYREAQRHGKTTSSGVKKDDFFLFSLYGISWGILKGEHHLLLRPDPAPFRHPWVPLPANQPEALTRAGITDVGASVKERYRASGLNLMVAASGRSRP